MIDFFDKEELDLKNIICHSGGAEGSDSIFESVGAKYGVITRAYSYKTKYHNSPNKIEISESDFQEGIIQVNKANSFLNRFGIHKYINLLARNWPQVKYSSQIIAIGTILNPGERSSKGYYCKSKYQSVDGGTGYAVMFGINESKPVYVFDQIKKGWFRWSDATSSFISCTCPKILSQNFTGIGTRQISQDGIDAIEDVYRNTFK